MKLQMADGLRKQAPFKSRNYYNEDIIVEILSRLPSKSLKRFRCACKSWLALMADSHFITKHRCHGAAGLRLFYYAQNHFESIDCEALSLENYNNGVGGPIESKDHGDMPTWCQHLFNSNREKSTVMGSCNGLICLGGYKIFVLWNPGTGDANHLPQPPYSFRGSTCFYGFGFDPITEDYMVILGRKSIWGILSVGVFSLKTGSWRIFDPDPNYVKLLRGQGCLLNGALHWLQLETDKHGYPITSKARIISFVLVAERFQELGSLSHAMINRKPMITTKHRMIYRKRYRPRIGINGNCLFVSIANHNDLRFHGDFEITIWIMMKYGYKESWTNVKKVPLVLFTESQLFEPMFILENGEVLMIENRRYFRLYNPKEPTYRTVFKSRNLFSAGIMYKETFVSPSTGREADT